jgi:(2S)-methylsuccinyl-CoA dehydrogenase
MSSQPSSRQDAGTGEATATLIAALDRTLETVIAKGAARTNQGKDIDSHQPQAERVAYFATEVRAAKCLADYASGEGGAEPHIADMALVFAAEMVSKAAGQLDAHADDLGISPSIIDETLATPAVRAAVRTGMSDERVAAIGRRQLETRGVNNSPVEELAAMTRDAVRQFAATEVAPIAEHIHRHDDLVPDSLIAKMGELGYFGMAVPEAYGGGGMGNLAMIITTEELSAVSLAAAGSLITRPEILTKALLKGGTDQQKAQWLPSIAAGKIMVGVSVTEPDTGSDVASLTCRAEPAERDGKKGWVVNGAKAWCTFAGRANVLALLARTDPNPKLGAKGLSLFIVPKDAFPGHAFEMRQPSGGLLTGKADATPGYRGMHSYTLMFDNYFVPGENLIGEAGGLGKGFYLQMAGFAAGRLQTGGRSTGLAQAALQRTCEYANDRKQFGKPIGQYGLTQYKLGRMATHIAASRQLTYAAARAMDEDETIALEPAMAKLFSSDVAVWVTQEGQQLHGGWGYAEEFAISRYVVDATVLPIFEGVKPILELKVIARNLLG